MERLWTPWRYEYVTGANKSPVPGVPEELSGWTESGAEAADCIFCNLIAASDYAIAHGMPAEQAEKAIHLIARGVSCFVCLNAFPYGTGHMLIVPYRHISSLVDLSSAEAHEMIMLAQHTEKVLRKVYSPDGLNLGLNLGEAAGAGIAGHLHMHALPRWLGDTNFMTAVADTRVLPEALETTWRRIRTAWPR
jgi:ATP adenylyltransferase